MIRFLPAVLLCALAACASAPRGSPVAMDASRPTAMDLSSTYRAEGEIFGAFGRAPGVTNSYGRYRVVGPSTNLSYTAEGRWGGSIAGEDVLLEAKDGRITGVGIDLRLTREGDHLLVSGLWRRARLDLTFTNERIQGTVGGVCSLDLHPASGTSWRGLFGCPSPDPATIALDGAAMEVPDVALPQWLFAFLGLLPGNP
jgi:hypothetical protein